jgi:hypothetical protein
MGLLSTLARPGQKSLTAAAAPLDAGALTAAAAPPRGLGAQFLKHTEKWQEEVWRYYDNLGEFNYGVWWLSNMLSRVRLRAAKLQPDVDEPQIEAKGPAAELMMRLGGGVSGQAQIMKRLTVQLSIPGEGYLIGEQKGKKEEWSVRSVDEIRSQGHGYYVMDEKAVNTGQEWRPLGDNSFVHRVWRPHDRYYHLADSPARSAREIMRELELVNRKIVAEYLSRLASAGLLALPDDITFPVREEFADGPNPLVREFIEVASEAIAKPGTASSVIPIPFVGPAESIAAIKHIDFTLKLDEKTIEKRESAIKRLATKLDMPAEILLGMGDVNHWGAWQLEEGALKTHIAPVAELICDSLTRGYLQPRLEASGEDPSDWVVWYDMSELALRPDRSTNATEAYDRLELSGEALRRELGFDEDDKPDGDDLKEQALKVIIKTLPSGASAALAELLDEKIKPIVPISPQDPGTAEAVQDGNTPPPTGAGEGQAPGSAPVSGPKSAPAQGPPDVPEEAVRQAARAQRLIQQSQTQHMVRYRATTGTTELLHPQLCHEHEYSCPYVHAVSRDRSGARPGTSGLYLCHLDSFGRLRLDGQAPYADTRGLISTIIQRDAVRFTPAGANGHG